MNDLEILMDLLDRPIAYHRAFVRLGAGITGALMLGQALYWTRRTDDATGWFYKTQLDWEEETGMSRREQEGARTRLRSLGLLEEAKRGVPCKTYYRVVPSVLQQLLRECAPMRQSSLHNTAKLDCTKPPSKAEQNRQSNSETTQRLQTTNSKNACADDGNQGKEPTAPKPRHVRTPLPADFAPSPQHVSMAAQLGLDLAHEVAQFKDYHLANGGSFLDWSAALRTWLRKAAQWGSKGGAKSNTPKTAPAPRQGAANGKLTDSNGQPKDYLQGIDDDGYVQ